MKPAFDPTTLQYVGTITLPAKVGTIDVTNGRGMAIRHVNGERRILFCGQTPTSPVQFPLLEAKVPDSLNGAIAASAVTNYGDIPPNTSTSSGVRHQFMRALNWNDELGRAETLSGSEYESTTAADATIGHLTWNGTGWTPGGRVGHQVAGVPQSGKYAQSAIMTIPPWFRPLVGGRRTAVGAGGYESVVNFGPASMGPALAAIDDPPDVSAPSPLVYVNATRLSVYPYTSNPPLNAGMANGMSWGKMRCHRGPDYSQPDINGNRPTVNGFDAWPFSGVNPTGFGYWTWGDWCRAATWVDTPTASGVLVFASQVTGTIEYYSATLNWQNSKHVLYVLDPADLAAVAAGAVPWSVQPKAYDWRFPGLTYPLPPSRDEPAYIVRAATVDNDLLFVLVAHGASATTNAIFVYRIPQTVPAPRPAGKPRVSSMVNPASASFSASPDHAVLVGTVPVLDGYRGRFVSPNSDDLVVDFGKPTPAGDGTITIALPALTKRKDFVLQIEVYGGGGVSESPASDPFVTLDAPAATGKPSLT